MGSRTRNDLVRAVTRLGITEARAQEAVEAFFGSIRQALIEGRKVSLTGFGTWEWRERRSREARNPRTGECIRIPARRVLLFRPSPLLKKRVNRKSSDS